MIRLHPYRKQYIAPSKWISIPFMCICGLNVSRTRTSIRMSRLFWASLREMCKPLELENEHILTLEIIPSLSDEWWVWTKCQPTYLEPLVSTNACSPVPKLQQHLFFPTKWPDEHLLWTHSSEWDQEPQYLCHVLPRWWDDLLFSILYSPHCCLDQTKCLAVQLLLLNNLVEEES